MAARTSSSSSSRRRTPRPEVSQFGPQRLRSIGQAGFLRPSGLIRAVTGIVDPLLELRPSLCSDLYLVARKSA